MIQIQELYVKAFGKLQDYTIRLEDGFNLIYGGNEAGKSTLQLFVRAMLYGLPRQRKQSGSMRDRDRALPWNGKKASGMIRLAADGRELEIRREFGRTASGDKVEVLDRHTGERLPELSVNEPGELLLGIPDSVFERTIWISQDGSWIGGKNEELSARLTNLCRTGDADVSITKARNYLSEKKLTLKARDRRNNAGEMDRLKEKRDALIQERYFLESQTKQRESSEKQVRLDRARLLAVETEIKEYEAFQRAEAVLAKTALADQLLRLKAQMEEIEASKLYRLYQTAPEDEGAAVEKLTDALKSLDLENKIGYDKEEKKREAEQYQRKKTLGWAVLLFGAVLLATGTALLFSPLAPLWAFVLMICGGAMGLTGGAVVLQNRTYLRSLRQEEARFREAETERAERGKGLRAQLSKLLSRYELSGPEEYFKEYQRYLAQAERRKLLQRTLLTLLGERRLEEVLAEADALRGTVVQPDRSPEETESALHSLRMEQGRLLQEIRDIENKVAYEFTPKTNAADLESELAFIDQDLAALQKEYAAIELAQSVMEEAYQQMKSDFTPQVNTRVNEILKVLTAGTHQQVRMSDDFCLKLAENENELWEAEYFSAGTYQQIYFALRMSIAGLIADPALPLFLDDLLMTYDDSRAERALAYLAELGAERQVLLFTCHHRDFKKAEQFGANIVQI